MYLDILKVLAYAKPVKVTHIMRKANLNCIVLKKGLDFLIKHGLTEEKTIEKRRRITVVYSITQKGITALKHLQELNQALPVLENSGNRPLLYISTPRQYVPFPAEKTENHCAIDFLPR